MDHSRDHQEDEETEKFLKELQEQREQQERDLSRDAHTLDVRRVQEMMTRNPSAMQHEIDERIEDGAKNSQDNDEGDQTKSRPLQKLEGNDPEANRWNTEKAAIEAHRDSPLGRGVYSKEIAEKMYEPSTPHDNSHTSTTGIETGKVLTDDREPGVSTHLHHHDDGTTISVKDQNTGKVERYNFDTGKGFEKSVSDMTPQEAQRRMRSEHTNDNPNPDKDTIPGFHSSAWTKSPLPEEKEDPKE